MLNRYITYTLILICLGLNVAAQCNFPSGNYYRCSGITLNATPATTPLGTTFTWPTPVINPIGSISGASASSSPQSIISLQLTNTTASPATATYTITPQGPSCVNPQPFTITLTVNPIPVVNSFAPITLCSGQQFQGITLTSTVANADVNWTNNNTSIGLNASGYIDLLPFTSFSFSGVANVAQISASAFANGCTGPTAVVGSITVNPVPSFISVNNQSICEGDNSSQINILTLPSTATVNWQSSNAQIGLAVSGTGNTVSSFTGLNPTNSSINSTLTATASTGTCTSANTTLCTFTIRPKPTVNVIANQEICNGGLVQPIVFSGPVSNTTFSSWTNSNTQIGLTAFGNGNISGFNAQNYTSANTEGIISITPTAGGCSGDPTEVTRIIVRPSPLVLPVSNSSICQGASFSGQSFQSNPAGAQFSWTSSNTGIGLNAQGQGSIPSFNGSNSGSSTIQVSAAESGCTPGAPINFTLTVKAKPQILNVATPDSLCAGAEAFLSATLQPANSSISFLHNQPGVFSYPANQFITLPFALYGSNPSTSSIAALFKLVAAADACLSDTIEQSLTILPLPGILNVPLLTACNGQAVDSLFFESTLAYTQINWANTNLSGGIDPQGIDFYIPAFEAQNISDSILVVPISINLLSTFGCIADTSLIFSVVPSASNPNATFGVIGNNPNWQFNLNNPNGIANVSWDFGDGSIADVNPVSHSYQNNGPYTVTCIVTDACGRSDTTTASVLVDVGIAGPSSTFEYSIFPNPHTEGFFIKSSKPFNSDEWVVLSIDGREMPFCSENHSSNEQFISSACWSNGVYFLRNLQHPYAKMYKLVKVNQ